MTGEKFTRMTPKQLRILTLIRDYQRKHGYSPTMQELADVLGITKVTVFEHIAGLEEKGLLRRHKNKARSLVLTRQPVFPDEPPNSLPLMGHIAAGSPIEAIENREMLDIEQLFGSTGQDNFVLKVRGDSMIDEHIRDGDLVIVHRQDVAKNGETVVALLDDGEATLKKFYKEKSRIRLQPANPKFSPIYVDNLRIQGVVVGVIRQYQ